MNYIIGAGGERDPNALLLATKEGKHIPNEIVLEAHPGILAAGVQLHRESHPEVRLRSVTATYSCVGMVFASRRTWVEIDQVWQILHEDSFKQIHNEKDVVVGDVVIYKTQKCETRHVGIVSEIKPILEKGYFEFWILSKWGQDGEYFHRIDDLPELLNPDNKWEFWTERRSI